MDNIWRWSFSPTKLKTTDYSSIPRISILEFSLLFYPCDYIKLVFTPHTNKHLSHRDMEFSEFLRFVGCWIYVACFEMVVDRHMWWSNTEVNFLREHQLASLNTCPSTGLKTSSTTCHTLIIMSPRTMKNSSTCVIWNMHGMQK